MPSLSIAILFLVSVVVGVQEWDGEFASRRFSQRYRIASDGKVWAESEVTVNAAASRVLAELSGDWAWWMEGGQAGATSASSNRTRSLGGGPLFSTWLELLGSSGSGSRGGRLSGVAIGPVELHVRPHARIPLRSVLTVVFAGVERGSSLLSNQLFARSLLWACRGDLSWYPSIRGFTGLIRKLEGFFGSKYDLLEDAQLDSFVHNATLSSSPSVLWASVVDTNVDAMVPVSSGLIDVASFLSHSDSAAEATARRLYMQFLVQVDPDQEQLQSHIASASGLSGGGGGDDKHRNQWAIRSQVKIELLQDNKEDGHVTDEDVGMHGVSVPFALVLNDASVLSVRLKIEGEEAVEMVVGSLALGPPGVLHQVALVFEANWTCLVTIDDAPSPVKIVLPEGLVMDQIVGLELRSSVRSSLRHVLITENKAVFDEVRYFSSCRATAVKDSHLVSSEAMNSRRLSFTAPSVSWFSLGLLVLVFVAVPVGVTRMAAFDSSLIPKRGLADKPLLYFRLAPSSAWVHLGIAATAGLCLVLSLVFHFANSLPSIVVALTARAPESLIWRIAVSILTIQRVMEAYLGFKTYIDKLTEKSHRVAFPLFQFHYWLWMNRVSLVAHVLETVSFLVMSLSSPFSSANVQHVALVLFYVFHLVHVFSHFRTFSEIKRSYHDDLIVRLRAILNAIVATVLCQIVFRAGFALTGLSGLDSVAVVCEWAFLAATFAWHHMVQREFIAPEDTRLYVGRRIALGASIRCSECLRPFSRTRTRETCTDCRDECCNECGTDVHLAELGAMIDMLCFFCSKCHRLTMAEMAALRAKQQLHGSKTTPRAGNSSGSSSGHHAPPPSQAKVSLPASSSSGVDSSSGAIEVCRMFQRGECTYGENCKYQHLEARRARAASRPTRPSMTAKASGQSAASWASAVSGSPSPPSSLAVVPAVVAASPVSSSSSPSEVVAAKSDAGHDSDGSVLDSSSGADLSLVERKKRRRGKRGQRKKKTGLALMSGESEDLAEELAEADAGADDEDDRN